jgi:hypothetical protein
MDLTDQDAVKAWLTINNVSVPTNVDVILARLIPAACNLIAVLFNRRDLFSTKYQEITDGQGGTIVMLTNRPVTEVHEVLIDGQAIPKADPSHGIPGFLWDEMSVKLSSGPGLPFYQSLWPSSRLGVYQFTRGFGNVAVTYTGGFDKDNPGHARDLTVLEQGAIEMIAQKFRRRTHVDETSQTFSGIQTVSFAQRDIPSEVATVVKQYIQHFPTHGTVSVVTP